MYNFKFVSKRERAPVKNDLICMIKEVQDLLRKDFTFRFDFVGSDKRNMVTCDPTTNTGYDFDVNIEVNDDDCSYTAKEIKAKIIWAINQLSYKYGYDCAEDSTRVITIKRKDRRNAKILYSCDFAIVNNYIDKGGRKRQEYIHFNKKQNCYTWKDQPDRYYILLKKAQWVKNSKHHLEMRELYLAKKNSNRDQNKGSRSLYAEAVHEICQRYGYHG